MIEIFRQNYSVTFACNYPCARQTTWQNGGITTLIINLQH